MIPRLLLACVAGLLAESHGFFHYPGPTWAGEDSGEPLFLTPYIKGNRTGEAARASANRLGGVESYSGFLTVDEEAGNNIFFWYFPALEDPERAPTIVWLQGGPGASSLYGLFEENGPLALEDGRLRRREVTWNSKHNMVYFDNPVGTGYSFTTNGGYRTNELDIGEDLHEAMLQLGEIFPRLKSNPLFIAGESYGGKYVPAFGYAVSKHGGLNLKGIMIGNGLIDPETQIGYGQYLFDHGFIDEKELAQYVALQDETVRHIQREDFASAADSLARLMIGFDRPPTETLFYKTTGLGQFYNTAGEVDVDLVSWMLYLTQPGVRRRIHAGDVPFGDGAATRYHLLEDVPRSAKPMVEHLLRSGVKVLLFNGQLDIVCAYPMAENFLSSLRWHGSSGYKAAPKEKWWVDGQLAGYKKRFGILESYMVRSATHLATKDQPEWVLSLVEGFTGVSENTRFWDY